MKVLIDTNILISAALNSEGTTLPDNNVTKAEGLAAFEELRKQAADIPEMSLDEINELIADVRRSK